MKKQLLYIIIMVLTMCPAYGQRASLGKLSPMLRQLVRQQTAQSRGGQESDHRQVCAFVKTTDADVLHEHGCRVLASAGQVHIASIPVSRLAAMALDRRVLRIEARRGNALCNHLTRSVTGVDKAVEGLCLPQAFTGKGVVVGVMDIGFDLTHPTFYDATATDYRIRRMWDMLSADTVGSPFYVGRDYVGREALLSVQHSRDGLDQTHGTHTAGTAAGSGYNSTFGGMAPESDICLVANAVADNAVFVDSADYYKYTFATDALGFKYLFDYAKEHQQPCVVSFSEGSVQDFWGYDQLYYEMLDSLTGPGRILVAAAGNQGEVKSWFRKPQGELSCGTFLTSSKTYMTLTAKSAEPFDLRFVLYTDRRDTVAFSTDAVLAQEDSVLRSLVQLDDYNLMVVAEAYPSCYEPRETCYDLTVVTTKEVGTTLPLSVEVLGREADVEVFRVDGHFTTNRLNGQLCAGEPVINVHSPSSAPCAISVGATSYCDSVLNVNGQWKRGGRFDHGLRTTFSSVGPTFDGRIKPDVVAPGNNIVSSYSSFYLENHPDADDIAWDVAHFEFRDRVYPWNSNSGTSMSCPAVAGAIALWLQAKPDLTPAEAKEVLRLTCRHNDPSLAYPNNFYGYGEIDAYRGLLHILGIDGVKDLSWRQSPVKMSCRSGRLTLAAGQPLSTSARLRVFDMNGQLKTSGTWPAGQSAYTISLEMLPPGVYAVQVDGSALVAGSSLVRR